MFVDLKKNDPPHQVTSFVAQVVVLNHPGQIVEGYTPVVDCHTTHISCKFKKLISKIDKRTNKEIEKDPKFIKKDESCIAELEPQKPMVVETFESYPPLGRFAVRDMRQTVAVGVVQKINKKEDKK